MKKEMMLGSKAGVTLIELLVVVLIVVILAVAMLPVLEPFITKAKYAADAIPALGNLRTQIALFKAEKEYLPGLQRNNMGEVLTDATVDNGLQWGSSRLLDQAYPQATATADGSYIYGQTLNARDQYFVQLAQEATGAALTFATLWGTQVNGLVQPDAVNNHFAHDLGISGSDLKGNNVKPENLIYAASCGGFKGNKHCYVVGAFGDGEKIKSGTGYAILEVANGENTTNPKFLATWKRWKPGYKDADTTVDQVLVSFQTAAYISGLVTTDDPASRQLLANNCYVPLELIQTGVPVADYDDAMTALRAAGWDF